MPDISLEPQAQLDGTAKRRARRLTPAEKAAKLVALFQANPTLWPSIQSEAKAQASEHGFVSVPAIFSRQRWERLANPDASPYKFNNDHAPLIARMLAFKFPDLAPLIELRRSRFDELDVGLVLQLAEGADANRS